MAFYINGLVRYICVIVLLFLTEISGSMAQRERNPGANAQWESKHKSPKTRAEPTISTVARPKHGCEELHSYIREHSPYNKNAGIADQQILLSYISYYKSKCEPPDDETSGTP